MTIRVDIFTKPHFGTDFPFIRLVDSETGKSFEFMAHSMKEAMGIHEREEFVRFLFESKLQEEKSK